MDDSINEIIDYVLKTPENTNSQVLRPMLEKLGNSSSSASVTVDPTLTLQGVPADAKAVGDAIAEISDSMITVDTTLAVQGMAADAKAVGNAIAEISGNSGATDCGCIGGYVGKNLSNVFTNAQSLHNAIVAGDFSKIHIGDYYPIRIGGAYYDAAAATNKTINAITINMEVAAINPYMGFGPTSTVLGVNHIVLCSNRGFPTKLKYRSEDSTWYDDTQSNPWRGSALWETLNNPTNGIIKLIESTDLGPYILKGANNKGIQMYMSTMAAGASAPTANAMTDRGRLFLPEEAEVFGYPVFEPATTALTHLPLTQWPIFAGSTAHIIKGRISGDAAHDWWLETATAEDKFSCVTSSARVYSRLATNEARPPLCFILT